MSPVSPVSVSTVVLDGQPFERGLNLLAEAGARSVEPAFIEGYMPFDETTFTAASGQHLARSLAAAGLAVRAVSAHCDLGQADSEAKLRRRLDFAAGLGALILISNATTVDRVDRLRQVIDRVLPDFAAAGVTLALENPGHGAQALFADGARGAAFVAAFGSPHLRMNYDLGNAVSYGAMAGTLAADLAAALPVAAHLHLKDLRDMDGDWVFCPVGQGDVGYGTAIPMHRIPADVPIGIEHPIRLWRPGHGDPRRHNAVPSEAAVIEAVRSALAFVARLRAVPEERSQALRS